MSNEDLTKTTHKRRPNPTKLGKIIRALRADLDMNMGDMAEKLGCSKSYISQVETGKIQASLEFLTKYIEAFKLDAPSAYNLVITAHEKYNSITIDMSKLRLINREYFMRLLAIIKFFKHNIGELNPEAHNLRNAIDAIWKMSIPDSTPETAPQTASQ